MSIKAFFAAMTLKMKIIFVCAAVVVIGGTAAVVGINLTKEEAYRVLKVFELTGNAVVTRADSGDLDAYVGMNLESGDMLTVGDNSTLRISMDSDKYILLDSGTVLELTATGTPTDSRTVINLKKGTILNEITHTLSANSSYEVSTPKSTMAVRGTSFMVSVEMDSDGAYIIRENTLQGKVEAKLLDSNGNYFGQIVLIPSDKGVTICVEPDENSGNPAEVDGKAKFVMEDINGNIYDLEEGADPLHDIIYQLISAAIRDNALRSNDENLMLLDENVLYKLRNGVLERSSDSTTTSETTVQTTTVTTTVTTPAETTVPETSEHTETTTETAVPAGLSMGVTETTTTATSTETTTTTTTTTTATETTTKVTTTTEETQTAATTTVTEETEATTTVTEDTTATSVTSATVSRPVTTTVPTESETTETTTVPTESETTETTTVPTEPETTETTTVPTEPETTETTTVPTESETTVTSTVPTESETTITTTVSANQGYFTISNNGNIISQTYLSAGDCITVPEGTPSDGYELEGWQLTNSDGVDLGMYQPGDLITYDNNFGGTLLLEAVYKETT